MMARIGTVYMVSWKMCIAEGRREVGKRTNGISERLKKLRGGMLTFDGVRVQGGRTCSELTGAVIRQGELLSSRSRGRMGAGDASFKKKGGAFDVRLEQGAWRCIGWCAAGPNVSGGIRGVVWTAARGWRMLEM